MINESPSDTEPSESRRLSQGSHKLTYLDRWRQLSRPARLYLLHAALLTSSLAIYGLFFNLLILALDYPRSFLGTLNTVSLRTAAVLSLPLWWLVTQIGLRPALLASGMLNLLSCALIAVNPAPVPLIVAMASGGAAAVLFQVSAPPLMMRHSDDASRDHLFSANAAINIGLAGVGSLVAGPLPALWAKALADSNPESPLAYRGAFVVAAIGLSLSLLPLFLIQDRRDASPRPEQRAAPPTMPPTLSGDRSAPTPGKRPRWATFRHLPEPWQGLARRPGPVIKLLAPPFFISLGAALLIPFLNVFFKERFGVSDVSLGSIFAALGVITGVAALAGPLLSARIGKIGTIIISQALSIPFLLLLGWTGSLPVALAAALLRAALFNLGSPLYDAFAMEHTDDRARPVVIGLINGAYTAGYLVAPEISTAIQERYGFGPLFIITAAWYSLAVATLYLFFGRQQRFARAP